MFHLYCYCQQHKHFGLSYVRLGRRSLVKSVHVPMIISVSLHHKQYDKLCEIQHESTKWNTAIIDVWCFTVILSSGGPYKCVYYSLLKARGQCSLQFLCLLCLGIWPTLNTLYTHSTIIGVVPIKLLHNVPNPL
jgi:hypothetical protein